MDDWSIVLMQRRTRLDHHRGEDVHCVLSVDSLERIGVFLLDGKVEQLCEVAWPNMMKSCEGQQQQFIIGTMMNQKPVYGL